MKRRGRKRKLGLTMNAVNPFIMKLDASFGDQSRKFAVLLARRPTDLKQIAKISAEANIDAKPLGIGCVVGKDDSLVADCLPQELRLVRSMEIVSRGSEM
jgi:hypothetical protein